MTDIKLIALDLDNTLLTNDKEINEVTRYWLMRARELGIIISFATGRGIQRTENFWQELKLASPMILVNGAEIWKKPGELLERNIIPEANVRELVRFAQENDARFWGYSVESLTHDRDWSEELYKERWLKFGIRHKDQPTIIRLREEVGSWNRYEVTTSHPTNMEISMPGINKAYGVKKVCEYLGITMDEVMAVGDSHNDLKMLQSVGIGVAMANATLDIKEAVNLHTSSNEESGVAKAIQRYIFNE